MNKNLLALTRATLFDLQKTISLDEKYLVDECLVVDSYNFEKSFDEEIYLLKDFIEENIMTDEAFELSNKIDFGKLDIRSSYILHLGTILYFLKEYKEKKYREEQYQVIMIGDYSIHLIITNLESLLYAFYISPIEE